MSNSYMFHRWSLFLVFLFLSNSVIAQQGLDPNIGIASNLYNRGDYERATMLYAQLFEENPDQALYYERFIFCLIYTKKYDDAAFILKEKPKSSALAQAHFFGEIHLKLSQNDKSELLTAFKNIPTSWQSNPQFYFKGGRLLSEYRMYEEALELYKLGQKTTGIDGLYRNELAMTALQGGFYESAVEAFLSMIQANPTQLSYVQRVWLRFGNGDLFEEGVFQIEEILADNSESVTNSALQGLLLWCYQELRFYKKALFVAKKMEVAAENSNQFVVFNLAQSLKSVAEFDLAKEALSYYLAEPSHPLTEVVLNELIDLEIAKINALKISDDATELTVKKAWELLYEDLSDLKARYHHLRSIKERIQVLQLRIAIIEKADYQNKRVFVDSLLAIVSNQTLKEVTTLSGILHLIKGDFRLSRLDLSKAIRLQPANKALDDMSAYYLGFSEWLNNQPEFAILQLKRFKSENASYYSNDALELRRIIIEGKSSDSTYSAEAKDLITAKWLALRGEYEKRDSLLTNFMGSENAVYWTSAAKQLLESDYSFSFEELDLIFTKSIAKTTDSPAKDELLWVFINYLARNKTTTTAMVYEDWINQLAENLIINYPNSIYANSAREIISSNV